MAEINEVISKEAIEGILKAGKEIVIFDSSIDKLITNIKSLSTILSENKQTTSTLNAIIKASAKNSNQLSDVDKHALKVKKELDAAEAALAKQKQAGLAVMAKQIAKEKEMSSALKIEVKSITDATRQNAALTTAKKKLDLTTKEGRATLNQYNATLNKNTQFIRQNGSVAEKQRMNIGNYGSAIKGVGTKLIAIAGAFGATIGVMNIFKGIIESTQGASDELKKVIGSLKESFGFLARSISTLNFTNLVSGFREAWLEGRRYIAVLDELADLQRSLDLQKQDIDIEIIELKTKAKNRSIDIKNRESYIDQIIVLEKKKLIMSSDLAAQGVANQLENAAFITKLDQDLVKDLVTNYDQYTKILSESAAIGEKLKAQSKTRGSFNERTGIRAPDYFSQEKYNKLLSEQTEEVQKYIPIAEKYANLNDKERDKLKAALSVQKEATKEFATGMEGMVLLENRLRSELLKKESVKIKVVAAVDKQINAYSRLSDQLKKLEDRYKDLVIANQPVPNSLVNEIVSKRNQIKAVEESVKTMATNLKTAAELLRGAPVQVNIAGGLPTPEIASRPAPEQVQDKPFEWDNREWTKEEKIEAAQITSNTIFDIIRNNDQAILDGKLSDLEKEKQARLSVANLTAKQKEKIEKEYDNKVRKLKTDAAKKEKSAAIIQAIINTALGVVKAIPVVPLMIMAGLVGAAQIAVIASQPLPKFDAGIESTPANFIAGERRPEWMVTPSGDVSLITRPTYFENNPGMKIIGGAETERIMRYTNTSYSDSSINTDKMTGEIVRAIQNKREIYISSSGEKITEREGNYNRTYFNRKVQWLHNQN